MTYLRSICASARRAAIVVAAAAAWSVLVALPLEAQQPPAQPRPQGVQGQPTPPTTATPRPATGFGMGAPGRDPLADAFFAPDLVMRYQQEIGLTAAQRTAIVAAMNAANQRFTEAQWELEPANSALNEMIRGERVNEQAVLAQIDRVLDIERTIKRAQIELMVKIKNQLTVEQQTQLARRGATSLKGLMRSPGMSSSPGMIRSPGMSSSMMLDGMKIRPLDDASFKFQPSGDFSMLNDVDFDMSGSGFDNFHYDMPDWHFNLPDVGFPATEVPPFPPAAEVHPFPPLHSPA